MNQSENWKQINGYEGVYEVSDSGRVRSVGRYVCRSDGVVQHKPGRLLKIALNQDGYCTVKLSKDGVSKRVFVHRLVADAFIDKPHDFSSNKYEVNHIDCKRNNNLPSNLEWIKHGDNVRYSIIKGNHVCTRDISGKNNPNYGNHILSIRYKANPDLAIQTLSRPGSQNGHSQKIALCDNNHNLLYTFDWIGECAQYLIDIGATKSKINSIRNGITLSIKNKKTYLNYYFYRL